MANQYPGGKNGAGTYQQLINFIPPHDIYIETHLGSGAIMRLKKPAPDKSYGIDMDDQVIHNWQYHVDGNKIDVVRKTGLNLCNMDAVKFLKDFDFKGNEFVYSDPPYLMSTRAAGKIYRHEYDDDDHVELLEVLKGLPCKVMVSGYWSELYGDMLSTWDHHSFMARTRQGMKEEFIFMNYPPPARLHDYRYLGNNFRERERIKRKKQRWVKRLAIMPILERQALLSIIEAEFFQ